MADRRSEPNLGPTSESRWKPRESGEVILLVLASLLGLLWAIVLVTHFHGPLSGVGQPLWLFR